MARVNRITGISLLVGVLLLVGTVAGAKLLTSGSGPAGDGSGDDVTVEPADVFCPGEVSVASRLSYPTAALPPGFAARVAAVEVKELAKVKAGAVLVRLDDTIAREQLKKAVAARDAARFHIDEAHVKVKDHQSKIAQQEQAVAVAEITWRQASGEVKKVQRLKGVGTHEEEVQNAVLNVDKAMKGVIVAKEQLQFLKAVLPDVMKLVKAAEAEVAVLEAQVKEAEALVNALVIKAPTDGRVLELNISVGDSLGTPTPNMKQPITFQPDEPLIIRAEVDQERASQVRVGQRVTLAQNASSRQEQWTGVVERVSPWIAPRKANVYEPEHIYSARTRECIIRINPGQPELLLGMQMRVQIHAESK